MRRTPWGANIARAVSGDPYVELPEGSEQGESCSQALVKAKLDWEVELKAVRVSSGKTIPKARAVVRQSDGFPMGVVGKSYAPIQNRELAMFADDLAHEAASGVAAVGSLDEGRRVFAVIDYGEYRPPGMGGTEVVNLSQIVHTRHDGGGSLTAGLYPLRLSCANGMRALIPGKLRSLRIRHTLRADQRLDEARRALQIGTEAVESFATSVERLLDTAYTNDQFAELMQQLMPVDEDEQAPATVTRRTNGHEAMFALWSESANLGDVRGTGYAAVNAIAEWEQWVRPMRGQKSREDAQMLGVTGGGRELAARAASLILT